jgi:hypothetical protein
VIARDIAVIGKSVRFISHAIICLRIIQGATAIGKAASAVKRGCRSSVGSSGRPRGLAEKRWTWCRA